MKVALSVIAAALVLSGCASTSNDAATKPTSPPKPTSPTKPTASGTATDDAAQPVNATPSATPSPTAPQAPTHTGPAVSVKHVNVHGRDVSLLIVNPDKTRFRFVPGTESPGGFNKAKDTPNTYRHEMLAAFNGAFLPQHTQGGYWFRGRSYGDLVDNRASLVINQAGRLDVVKWDGRDPANYQVVRQNLRMLIDDGVDKTLGLNGCDDWGPLGTGAAAHRRCPGERSAVGVTKDGTVIYAFGFEVMAGDLAAALKREKVVRAMPLEINNWWPSAFTYTDGKGKRIDPSVRDEPTRYSGSTSWKRDFVVVLPR